MAFRRREIKKTKIEIIPMIDTMFFLLVFFILASLNVIDVKGSQVSLPVSTTQDPQARAPLTITIQRDRTILVNKTITVSSAEKLGEILLGALQAESGGATVNPADIVVVINADREAPYSLVRQCIDDARMVKFRKFSIATDPKFGR